MPALLRSPTSIFPRPSPFLIPSLRTLVTTCRAVLLPHFGGPEVLQLRSDVHVPILKPHEVLVHTRAVSINPLDTRMRSGYGRSIFEPLLPVILGRDISGEVASVGSSVRSVSVGQEVFGALHPTAVRGTYTDYAILSEDELSAKPESLTHVEASAIPFAALTAWRALKSTARITEGQRVLVIGGGGAVGYAAVQLSVASGCHVTTTCGSQSIDKLLAAGAEQASVSGDSPQPYNATDNILLNCGSSENSSAFGDDRTWVGDVQSKFFSSDFHHNGVSIISQAQTQSSPVTGVPYVTARLSRSEFTYSFPLSPGKKFIRLYFYPAFYSNFDRFKAVFSVKTALHTLLANFNASLNADASDPPSPTITPEFCVYAEGNDQMFNITFSPTNQDSYAFINGIEIVSMPLNLYYPKNDHGGRGLKIINQNGQFRLIDNNTSLERVYRMNIGGNPISPVNDTGMFRTWTEESNLLNGYVYDARPADLSLQLDYINIPPYTAPGNVYRTARTMGPNTTLNKSYNLTWEYPVDPGFHYMLRLHFCEFEAEITAAGDRVFLIYIGNNMADQGIDVFQRAGGKGRPMYEDYGIFVSNTNQKKVNLSVKLQANPDDAKTRLNNVILNGVEIFKINDLNGNLGGQNPDPPPTTPAQSLPPSIPQSNNPSNTKIVGIVIPVVVGGVVAILALGLFLFRRRKTFTDQTSSDGTSWWASNLTWTKKSNKSSKTRNSNLPSDICRHFSLGEIKDATKNFDEIFIIGVGGFGNVYKGYIDDGATQVAIKRLKPGSKQGAHEFKTEIEMLSQLRHLHLVSLIGYCNDGNEMILVYDYMSHGTLRSHLYGNDEQQPLTWNQRLQVCIGAAKGLHYLHTGANHTIIHRDVKTTNILLDEKWIAKVSDFGLSKVGPANMPNNAHISTVVKGSFGYLDPEYYRRQQLTEKSDVYSFGVVLCEVLCARPPLIRAADKKQVYLAEWVRRCHRDNTVAQTIDPNIKNEISPECLRKFIEIAVGCIEDDGIKRPSMNDVVWGLEFGLKLQEASKKKGAEDDVGSGEEQWFLDETLFSSTGDGRHDSESGVSSYVTTTNSNDLSYTQNKGMSSTVFSEINDPIGR